MAIVKACNAVGSIKNSGHECSEALGAMKMIIAAPTTRKWTATEIANFPATIDIDMHAASSRAFAYFGNKAPIDEIQTTTRTMLFKHSNQANRYLFALVSQTVFTLQLRAVFVTLLLFVHFLIQVTVLYLLMKKENLQYKQTQTALSLLSLLSWVAKLQKKQLSKQFM
jgi:hypothetical protein